MEEIKPRRIIYRSHPDPERGRRGEKVKALSLDFKVIEEHWNIYELEDGTRVRVRLTPRRFDKPLDPQTEKVMYNKEGTPIYGIDMGVETVFDYPEELVKP